MNPVVYDKAKWHWQHKSYPPDLEPTAANVVGGFFLAWAGSHALFSTDFLDDWPDIPLSIEQRSRTPGDSYDFIDGILMSEMFSPDGVAFAEHCFESEAFDYYDLFESVLASGLPSLYHVADTWENYDRLALELDKEYREFLGKGSLE